MRVAAKDSRRLPIFIHSELDDAGLDPYAFRVYCRLARRAGGQGAAWESVGNMADACRMSSRRARQALRTLETKGLIRRDERDGQTSVYHLLDVPTPAPDAAPPRHHMPPTPAPDAAKGIPMKEIQLKEDLQHTSANADARGNGSLSKEDYDRVMRAYNDHRGPLPEARVMNSKRRSMVRTAAADLGGVDEVAAALAVAAREVADDPRRFYERNGYGIDTLLTGQKFIQKAEAAMARGGTDRDASERDRMMEAIADL